MHWGGGQLRDSALRASFSPRVVFSLTSFPARIATLHHTIFSLLRQSTPADEIAVFLSLEEFPRGFASLPRILRFLHTQHFIRLHFVEANYKSCNKLIHALKFYTQDICVTIDDDQLYERDMLRLLLDSYRKYPQCIHTHHADMPIRESSGAFAWRACELEDTPLLGICPLGVSGVLYPPHCLDTEVFNTQRFYELAPHNDDLWFFVMGMLKESKKVLVKGALGIPKQPSIAIFESPNLWETNAKSGENRFMIEWENLVRAYPEIQRFIVEE
ncbi:glycosyltransferase family A protein [uncultured Helicobacter sp.]|uniref:glycosyltransferase family A protein n=1 Tax=uncultured Helicobacter sp. TaxID=175537 RepID=UPI0037508D5A